MMAHVFITKPEAYDLIWKRLSSFYDDVSCSVQSALEGLAKLKPVQEEGAYSQLEELGHTDILSMRDIDRIAACLPQDALGKTVSQGR